MTTTVTHRHVWTRRQYEKMVKAGVFAEDDRVQLLQGEVVDMTPQSSRHATAIRQVQVTLEHVFRDGFDMRCQLPLALSDQSEPEPDLAVVPGHFLDYQNEHPRSAALVVEVAESSLELDRKTKGAIYAGAGIPEFWIVNLVDERLEVYREPDGDAYRSCRHVDRAQSVTPVAGLNAPIAVRDLLL